MKILKQAVKTLAFAKIGILGFPGSGKTFTATLIGAGLCEAAGNRRLAFFDSESGSDFLLDRLRAQGIEVFQAKSRAFSDLLTTIQECQNENVPVLIIDSITHVWKELMDAYDKKLKRNGRLQFQDWAIIKKEWARYTDLFLNAPLHIIVCGRAGYEYDYTFNEDGSKDLIKTATRMKVESEFAFEPSLVLEMERIASTEDSEVPGKARPKPSRSRKTASRWIHRAYVLKDRTDSLNGRVFDNPVFDDFKPHFKNLNIGGEHLAVDTSRTSDDRFDIEGKPSWKKERDRAEIALEEIQAEVAKYFPGSSAAEKRAKIRLAETVFHTASAKALEGFSYMILEAGLKRIRTILSNTANIKTLLSDAGGEMIEPAEDDIPEFKEAAG